MFERGTTSKRHAVRIPATGAAVLAIGLLLGACSTSTSSTTSTPSSPPAASGSSASGSAESPTCATTPSGAAPTLTVAVVAVEPDFSPFYVAKGQNYFAKCGVNIDFIDNSLGNTLADLSSGHADLAVYSTAAQAALQGLPVSIVYLAEVTTADTLLTKHSITSIDQLRSTPGCRIGVSPHGSAGYGGAKQIIQVANLGKCQQVILASTSLLIDAVTSGSIDAIVSTGAESTIAVSQGAHELVSSSNPADINKYFPVDSRTPAVLVFGQPATVSSKSEAVVRMIRALNLACTRIDGESDAAVAADLQASDPLFKPITNLTSAVTAARPQICQGLTASTGATPPGFISQDEWTKALNAYATWDITGFERQAPSIQYAQIINMTYYNQAFGK